MIPTPISEEVDDDDHEASNQVTTEPRRSTSVRFGPEWYGNHVLEVMLLDHDEPTNYEQAMMSLDFMKCLEAMKSEIGSMYENKVWTLVDLPDDRLIKTEPRGEIRSVVAARPFTTLHLQQ